MYANVLMKFALLCLKLIHLKLQSLIFYLILVLVPPLQGEGLLDLDCQVKHSWCEYQGWEQL